MWCMCLQHFTEAKTLVYCFPLYCLLAVVPLMFVPPAAADDDGQLDTSFLFCSIVLCFLCCCVDKLDVLFVLFD